jgi:pSer/pThr/pTyr-binding forkhead associated (FHA) protein
MNKHENNTNTESIREQKADITEEISEKILMQLKKIPHGKRGLLVIKGPSIGDIFYIEKDEFIIGRSPESDVLLDDITVSRKHALLKEVDGDYRLLDAGSLNGSYLNGNIVEEAVLSNGDRIQIGKYIFLYFSIKRG